VSLEAEVFKQSVVTLKNVRQDTCSTEEQFKMTIMIYDA